MVCGSVPWISLLATVVLCLGVGLFCGAGYQATQTVLNGIFVGLFHFYVQWLESIEIGFFVFAIFMALFAIILLLFGFLATSATKGNIYSGAKCIMGGRISAFLFLALTYMLNIAWMCVTSFCSLAIVIYIMLNSVCLVEIEQQKYQYIEYEWEFCLNLSRFGIYRNITYGMDTNALCDESDLSDFCKHVHKAGPQFCIAFAGSFLIVLGLILYTMALGSNYSKIQTSKEITNYRQTFALDDMSRDNLVR